MDTIFFFFTWVFCWHVHSMMQGLFVCFVHSNIPSVSPKTGRRSLALDGLHRPAPQPLLLPQVSLQVPIKVGICLVSIPVPECKIELQIKKHCSGWKRGHGRKEKVLYFRTFKGLFFLLFEQEALHFHFVLGPTNYVTGPDSHTGNRSAAVDVIGMPLSLSFLRIHESNKHFCVLTRGLALF